MSEFRQEIVSGDWIIMAPDRAARPTDLISKKSPRRPSSKATCPFERPEKTAPWPPVLSYPDKESWEIVIIPNKYPVLTHREGACATVVARGNYPVLEGIGYHDLVVTRDHTKDFSRISPDTASHIFLLLQEYYHIVRKDKCLLYTSTFFNWGESAGASLYHPHYQVLTLPIIPPDVAHSLKGARNYFSRYRRCAHCHIVKSELKAKKRIVYKNTHAVAIAPFASREPFQVTVFPRKHESNFEEASATEIRSFAQALQAVLKKFRTNIGDPDLNFYVHTAPLNRTPKDRYYHWHVEVVPKITINAGFELSTGVEINVVDPDNAASVLRR